MLTKDTGDYLLYYREGQDPEEEFVAQYHHPTRKLMNFWGTIEMTMSPTCTNMVEVVEKLEAFEKAVAGALA
jgi:hypothetical protein